MRSCPPWRPIQHADLIPQKRVMTFTILLSESTCFQIRNFTLFQIQFVSNKHQSNIGTGQFPCICDPFRDTRKRVATAKEKKKSQKREGIKIQSPLSFLLTLFAALSRSHDGAMVRWPACPFFPLLSLRLIKRRGDSLGNVVYKKSSCCPTIIAPRYRSIANGRKERSLDFRHRSILSFLPMREVFDLPLYRKRSCPAVSQIWSLTWFFPIVTILLPNSTPIVCVAPSLTIRQE